MENKHIEGPWFVTRGAQQHPFSIESGTKTIAFVKMQTNKRETELNAGLLHAAPELLEACKLAPKIAETLMDELVGKKAANWGIINDGLVKIQQAINKAEGSTQ